MFNIRIILFSSHYMFRSANFLMSVRINCCIDGSQFNHNTIQDTENKDVLSSLYMGVRLFYLRFCSLRVI
jgi:hypothetical protein